MKIVDTFLFHNEYDLLELRFRQHYDHVDRFVISECDHTFTGIYKGFNLELHKERFAPWWDKVVHLKMTNPPKGHAWNVERWQRENFSQGWTDLSDDDVVLIADVDELIRPEAFDFIRNTDYAFYGLCMPTFYYRFNYMNLGSHYPWRVKGFRGYRGSGEEMRHMSEIPGQSKIELDHAGWHFSWLGNESTVLDKLRSFSHTEYNGPSVVDNLNIEQSIASGKDHMHRQYERWGAVKFDEYFPKYIVENADKFQHLIIPNGEHTVQHYWPYGILATRTN